MLRMNNKIILRVIEGLVTEVLNTTENKKKKNLIRTIVKGLIHVELQNKHRIAVKRNSGTIDGSLIPKHGSWLDVMTVDEKFLNTSEEFNMTPFNNKLISSLRTKLNETQTINHDFYLEMRKFKEIVDNLTKTIKIKEPDNINIITMGVPDVLRLFIAKGYIEFYEDHPVKPNSLELKELKILIESVLSYKLTAGKEISYDLEVRSHLENLLISDMINELEVKTSNNTLDSIHPREILLYSNLFAVLTENKDKLSVEEFDAYQKLGFNLYRVTNMIDFRVSNNLLVNTVVRDEHKDEINIYVFKDVLDKYLQEGGSLNALKGVVIDKNIIINLNPVGENRRLGELLKDKISLLKRLELYKNGRKMTANNFNRDHLLGFYTLAFNKLLEYKNNGESQQFLQQKLESNFATFENYINKKSISELKDVDYTVVSIFRDVLLRDNNFSIFLMNFYDYGKITGDNNVENALLYADISLVVKFFFREIEMV